MSCANCTHFMTMPSTRHPTSRKYPSPDLAQAGSVCVWEENCKDSRNDIFTPRNVRRECEGDILKTLGETGGGGGDPMISPAVKNLDSNRKI